MQIGSSLMRASLQGYAVLKVAGRGQGLEALRAMLARRFTGGRAVAKAQGDASVAPPVAAPPAPEED
jgi:hypothetical protein